MQKTLIQKLTKLLWLVIVTFVLSVMAGGTLHVIAALTEPPSGSAASDQDFPENILGANNADNDFSSALVAQNGDGSLIERLEYIRANYVEECESCGACDSCCSGDVNYASQTPQVYDDWNCSNNNAEADSACAAGDAEYTGEEGTWTAYYDTNLNGANVASGTVYKDERTGLYWSDCYDSASGGGSCDTRTNDFYAATVICTDSEINNGTCDIAGTATTSQAITFCQNLSLDADGDGTDETDWYLPSQKELMQAYINGAGNNLPNPANYYWSATDYNDNSDYAWTVYLHHGYTDHSYYSINHYARCARR